MFEVQVTWTFGLFLSWSGFLRGRGMRRYLAHEGFFANGFYWHDIVTVEIMTSGPGYLSVTVGDPALPDLRVSSVPCFKFVTSIPLLRKTHRRRSLCRELWAIMRLVARKCGRDQNCCRKVMENSASCSGRSTASHPSHAYALQQPCLLPSSFLSSLPFVSCSQTTPADTKPPPRGSRTLSLSILF